MSTGYFRTFPLPDIVLIQPCFLKLPSLRATTTMLKWLGSLQTISARRHGRSVSLLSKRAWSLKAPKIRIILTDKVFFYFQSQNECSTRCCKPVRCICRAYCLHHLLERTFQNEVGCGHIGSLRALSFRRREFSYSNLRYAAVVCGLPKFQTYACRQQYGRH